MNLLTLKQLHVHATGEANVWRISLPKRPWKFDSAERERRSVIETLSAMLPFRSLWLSDWANENHSGWSLLTPDESLVPLEEKLTDGAWALFFFAHDSIGDLSTRPSPPDPKDAAEALNVLRDIGADAAIWSWYDDNEWLVAVPNRPLKYPSHQPLD